MKKSLSAGFIILLPIALTIWIFAYFIDLFTDPLYKGIEMALLMYEQQRNISLLHHEAVVIFLSRLIALIASLVFVFLIGFLGRKFFFDALLQFAHKLIVKIPLIGTIYRLTKDITKALFASEKKAFQETVLVPFPSKSTHAVGFITGNIPENLKKIIQDADVTVFVPTAPHPVSGYLLFTPKNVLYDVDLSTEETFKFLISCGTTLPPERKDA